LENAYEKAYVPFIKILKRYPFIKISIHYSRGLWDFFKEEHPEFLEALGEMAPTMLAILGIWRRDSPVIIIRGEVNTRRGKGTLEIGLS
jgi:hypothetical protein